MRHRSSFIAQTSYEHDDGTLVVEFTDGKTFQYDDVPRGIYTALITSRSLGEAWHALIKDRFVVEEV